MPWSLTKTSLGRRQFIWLTFPRHYPSARSAHAETMEDHSSLIWLRLMYFLMPPRTTKSGPSPPILVINKENGPTGQSDGSSSSIEIPSNPNLYRIDKTNWVNSRCFFTVSYMYTVDWGLLPTSHFHSSPTTTTHSFRFLFSVYQFEFCLVSTELNQGHLYDP